MEKPPPDRPPANPRYLPATFGCMVGVFVFLLILALLRLFRG